MATVKIGDLPNADYAIDLALFKAFPNYIRQASGWTTYTSTAAQTNWSYTQDSSHWDIDDIVTGGRIWGPAPAPVTPPPPKEEPKLSIAELQRKLADMLGQVEAQEKARPVLQAIDAMHGYRKSDGRPFTHYDPLLKE